MVLLGCTFATFTDAHWQKAFGAYIEVNKSHWTGPPFTHVQRTLEMNGLYEFSVPVMGTWYSKFRIAVLPDGQIDAQFVENVAIQGRARERLAEMERAFVLALTCAA